ncbi:MAG TPA: hypothetical protein VJG30_03660 [Candidatus Nanoarchaeia archaeon]|nr:hypothetical protein [Candidatus Nanoarchaeia archaeon]
MKIRIMVILFIILLFVSFILYAFIESSNKKPRELCYDNVDNDFDMYCCK